MTRLQNRGVLGLLWSFAFLSYLLRANIATAQQFMARDLSLSDTQVGYIFTAFLIGYTIFQVPAGMLGDRFGPRTVLTVSGLFWAVTTLCTGIVPGLLVKGFWLALGLLLTIRFLHGIGEAATYPVAMNAVAIWFPRSQHALVNAIIFTGSTLGAAFAPPLVSHLMLRLDWRATFYLTAFLPVVVAILWWNRSRHSPQSEVPPARNSATWWALLAQRDLLFLSLSYFLYCYSISVLLFWLFKYLVDVRHLSIANSGWATGLPWLLASITVPAFGWLSTRLADRLGPLPARRLVASACLLVSAVLLLVGAGAQQIALALGAIALCVALLFSTESSYWSTAIDLAHGDEGSASGLMNLAGNLGGVTSTLLVPVLVVHSTWFTALASGSVFAVLATGCWFLIHQQTNRRIPEAVACA